MALVKVVMAPRGWRWPWYPVYRGEFEQVPGSEAWSVEFRPVGPLTKGRIGLRMWLSRLRPSVLRSRR